MTRRQVVVELLISYTSAFRPSMSSCNIKMTMIIMYDDGLLIVFCAVVHRPSSMCMYVVASKWV